MKYAEIKEKMTQGEWRFGNHHSWEIYSPHYGEAVCTMHVKIGPMGKGFEWEDEKTKASANAHAIFTAVSNTYHKGINPEAVPKLVDAIFFYMGATHPDVRQRARTQVQQALAMAMGKE